MATIDRRAQDEFAIPSALLMEDAGVCAWSLFVDRAGAGRLPRGRLVFVAGKGNNGGDALVMARRALCQGARGLTVVLADGRPQAGGVPSQMLAPAEAYGIECRTWQSEREQVLARLRESSWIFDGVSGHGASRRSSGSALRSCGRHQQLTGAKPRSMSPAASRIPMTPPGRPCARPHPDHGPPEDVPLPASRPRLVREDHGGPRRVSARPPGRRRHPGGDASVQRVAHAAKPIAAGRAQG